MTPVNLNIDVINCVAKFCNRYTQYTLRNTCKGLSVIQNWGTLAPNIESAIQCGSYEYVMELKKFGYIPDISVYFHYIINTNNYEFVRYMIDVDIHKKTIKENFGYIVKNCEIRIVLYLTKKIKDDDYYREILCKERLDLIKYHYEENEFDSKLVKMLISRYGHVSYKNWEFLRYLHGIGVKIDCYDMINALKTQNLEDVKWTMANGMDGELGCFLMIIHRDNIYSSRPEVVLWMLENKYYAHPNLKRFIIDNDLHNLDLVKFDIGNEEITLDLLVYYSSINQFELVEKHIDDYYLCDDDLARVLYYVVKYERYSMFQTRSLMNYSANKVKLLLNLGGKDALISFIKSFYFIYSNKFIRNYATTIISQNSTNIIQLVVDEMNYDINEVLIFHKNGRPDMFYHLCNKKKISNNFLSNSNIRYVCEENDLKLIQTVWRKLLLINIDDTDMNWNNLEVTDESFLVGILKYSTFATIEYCFTNQTIKNSKINIMNHALKYTNIKTVKHLLEKGFEFNYKSLKIAYEINQACGEWLSGFMSLL